MSAWAEALDLIMSSFQPGLPGVGEYNPAFMDTLPDTLDDEPQAANDMVFEHAGT